jgi:hypothetical protein
MSETRPKYRGQTKYAHEHKVRGVEGTFHELVWKCDWCGRVRTVVEAYRGLTCE